MEDMGKALDPDSCRRSCSPTNDRVTYEASVNDGRVVEKSWTQGSKSPPNMSLLKGCEIVDDKNWSCTEMEPGTLSSTQSRDDHVVTIINIDTKDLKMASLYCMVP